jgi:hypothetical protein
MTLLINGNKFETRKGDTPPYVVKKIAIFLKTAETYLYFKDLDYLGAIQRALDGKKVDLAVVNLLEFIQNSVTKNGLNLADFILGNLDMWLVIGVRKACKIWCIYNPKLTTASERQTYIMVVADDIKALRNDEYIVGNFGLERLVDNYITERGYLDKEVVRFYEDMKAILQADSNLEDVEEIPHVIPEIKTSTFTFPLTFPESTGNVTMFRILDSIQPSDDIPLAISEDYYKLYKKVKPCNDWLINYDTVLWDAQAGSVSPKSPGDLLVYIMLRAYPNKDKYVECTLFRDEDSTIKATMTSLHKGRTSDEMKGLLVNALTSLGAKAGEIDIKKLSSVWYIPAFSLDRYLLADMVLIDPNFYPFLVINERDRTMGKSGADISLQYRDHTTISPITVYITDKMMTRTDSTMSGKSKLVFPEGERYIQITVNNTNNSLSLNNLVSKMARIFTLYKQNKDRLMEEYTTFLPDFDKYSKKHPKIQAKDLALKDLVPELFPSGFYTGYCGYPPTIIDEEEAAIYRKAGKSVMKFPKDGEYGEPHYYVCNHKTHPYPGLKINNPKSPYVHLYDYVPCCYKNSDAVGSRAYFKGDEGEDIRANRVIKTSRVVQFNYRGTLPKNINKLLVDPLLPYEYLRLGTRGDQFSAIECLVMALGYDKVTPSDYTKLSEKKQLELLVKIKTRADMYDVYQICKQELYNYTLEEIKARFVDNRQYISPLEYLRLLEYVFKCNIFVFSRDTEHPEGYLKTPPYSGLYVRRGLQYDKTVFLYEHAGSSINVLKYMRCELIVRAIDVNPIDALWFSVSSKTVKKVVEAFDSLIASYYGAIRNEPLFTDLEVTGQLVDSNGKTRVLMVGDTPLYTNPIQPFSAPLVSEEVVSRRVSAHNAIKTVQSLGGKVLEQAVVDKDLLELRVLIDGVEGVIPVERTDTYLDKVPVTNRITIPAGSSNPRYKLYDRSRNLAIGLYQQLLYVFSVWIHKKAKKIGEFMKYSDFAEFRKSFDIRDDGCEYNLKSMLLSLDNSYMVGGKVCVENEDVMRRLIYMLWIDCIRNPTMVVKYRFRDRIERYSHISDFRQGLTYVVIQGKYNVSKWSSEQIPGSVVHDKFDPTIYIPYFMYNNGRVVMVQNSDDLEKAVMIGWQWNKYGNNIGNNPPTREIERMRKFVKDVSYHIITDYSAGKVISKKVGGGTDSSIEIHSYEDNTGEVVYATILQFKTES